MNKFWICFLFVFGGFFFFSHSAFAASDISISSSGTVSFGKVQPSSIGTLVTGEDNLSVSTTCTEGANVYASSVNDNGGNSTGTSLINLAAKAKDSEGTSAASYTINTSSAAIGSATTLVNNTWGLNTNTAEAASGLYYGLPAFSDSTTPTAIYTGTATSIPVYFGVRVTSTLVPGTYTGQVLYTATVNTACLNYTVTFNKNSTTATGSMENQTILPAGGSLRANSFEYPGYTFLGWSTSPEGKTGTAVDGIGTEADVEYENEALFPDATTSPDIEPGDGVTLYAIWKKDGYGEDTMQGWTGCATLATNASVTLTDARDNHEYKVKKLPDGKCWMIQNLTLSADDMVTKGKALTSANTNIENNTTYYLPKRGYQGSITSSSTPTSTSSTVDFSDSSDNQGRIGYRAKGTTDNGAGNPVPEDTAYYNFYTATLGFSYYNDGKDSGSSPRDICPKGWRLPWTSDSGTTRQGSAEFYKLALAYNSDSSVWSYYIAPTSTGSTSLYSFDDTIIKNMILDDSDSLDPTLEDNGAAGFTYAGVYVGTTPRNVGTSGYYWSSSVYDSTDGYNLHVSYSARFGKGVLPQFNDYKYLGFAVRCVREPSYMQDFDSSTLASNQVVSLVDKRDNHVYKVKKLPDGKVWMIQNLTLSATDLVTEGKALTSANTNIPASDTNSYYIPPRNTRYATADSITNSAVATASATVDFSSGNSNQPQVGYRAKGTTDNNKGNPVPEDTAYYPFYTATLGFSYYNDGKTFGSSPRDICPKGWRLPWTSDSGSTKQGSAELYKLALAYNSNSSVWSNYIAPTSTGTSNPSSSDTTIRKNMILGDSGSLDPTLEDNGAAGFTYAGYYSGTTLYVVGAYGGYWSSSVYDSYGGYSLYSDTSDVYPQINYGKNFGGAVRCVTGS